MYVPNIRPGHFAGGFKCEGGAVRASIDEKRKSTRQYNVSFLHN